MSISHHINSTQSQQNLKDILTACIEMLYQYDQPTFNHSLRVEKLATLIARSMSCSRNLVNRISIAALLHDIGKINIPKYILNKPDSLSSDERLIIQTHALFGYIQLSQYTVFDYIKDIILHHHERYDGQGYPYGLKKHRIPFESRVITVADTFDALTSSRVYHEAMLYNNALLEINRNVYKRFDPWVVEHLNYISKDVRRGYTSISLQH